MLPMEITSDEKLMLEAAEKIISTGLRTFLHVGQALAQVRDHRLYRQTHSTFEDYCRERWNITDRRARQMIDAADVVAALPTGTTVPVSERSARELVGLAPEQAAQVIERAEADNAGKVTADTVREARRATFLPSGKPDARSMRDMAAAVPPVRPKPRRRPLPKQYWDAVYDLDKAIRRLEKIQGDDRFNPAHESYSVHGPRISGLLKRLTEVSRSHVEALEAFVESQGHGGDPDGS